MARFGNKTRTKSSPLLTEIRLVALPNLPVLRCPFDKAHLIRIPADPHLFAAQKQPKPDFLRQRTTTIRGHKEVLQFRGGKLKEVKNTAECLLAKEVFPIPGPESLDKLFPFLGIQNALSRLQG